MFHSFQTSIAGIELPRLFTYPFHYTPHPLCVMAAGEVQAYINKQTRWKEELDKGKMFGVLIVRTSNGQTGYLAAFSGNLCGSNSHSFFVPPVYDLETEWFLQDRRRTNLGYQSPNRTVTKL